MPKTQLEGSVVAESDQATWSRLCTGDPAALTEIYERHVDTVYNFAFRRTASWSVAEDAVQPRSARSGDGPEVEDSRHCD